MKQKPKLRQPWLIMLLFLAKAGPLAFPESILSLDRGGGVLFSFTSLPQLDTGLQIGWNKGFGLGFAFLPSARPEKADIEVETAKSNFSLIGRFQLDTFALDASAPQSDGNLYRGWQGTGLGILLGIATPEFQMPLLQLPASFGIEAGGGLRLTKYSGTGLISAYPALLGRMMLNVEIINHFALGFFIPFEWAWKSGGWAIILGAGLSMRFS